MTPPPAPDPAADLEQRATRARTDRKLFAHIFAVPCAEHAAQAGEPCWTPAERADGQPPVCAIRARSVVEASPR